MVGWKVLIVEDDPIVLMVAAETFRSLGFLVTEVDSAEAALSILHEAQGALDAVFTDIETPGALDGLHLARTVVERWPTTAVVVTSGRTAPPPEVIGPRAQFVAKPYDAAAVAALVSRLVLAGPASIATAPLSRLADGGAPNRAIGPASPALP